MLLKGHSLFADLLTMTVNNTKFSVRLYLFLILMVEVNRLKSLSIACAIHIKVLSNFGKDWLSKSHRNICFFVPCCVRCNLHVMAAEVIKIA